MKKFPSLLTLILVVLAIYWAFESLMPSYDQGQTIAETEFSTDRALTHVKAVSQDPHGVGSKGHADVRKYIMEELQKMGLEPTIQEGHTVGDWANLSKAINIMARIEGKDTSGKALLLLTHYDSSPHSSLGASDAGSGVATLLEGVRAFLAQKVVPKNDIIILITDAEELGLNGADLFVNQHPWAKEVGLVLNFEARGSGGPSYMLIETNGGNAHLIEEFTRASPQFPVANSLMYSIYKMLPNDTDLTVFREDGDIEGFNFAFIDDHFDYHTVRDNYERLDRNTLAHQGSYLMPLVSYFAQADLNGLKSDRDLVYFSFPFFGLVSFPFTWIWPLFMIGLVFFVLLVAYGFKEGHLQGKKVLIGFVPALLVLLVNGVIGYFGWTLLTKIYPHYRDILHGFPYNGHIYIMAFVFLTTGICLWIYAKFKKISLRNLLVAPAFIWLSLSGVLFHYLPGAAFFIIPILSFLVAFMVVLNQERPSALLLVFLAIPSLWIFAPFIQMFPVGLGLKMMVTTTLLAALLFLLTLPLIGFYRRKRGLAWLSLFLCLVFLARAHMKSGFTEDRAKPTSLLYVQDENSGSAQWATYEKVVSDWTAQYLGEKPQKPQKLADKTLSSKYGSGFSWVADAPNKKIAPPLVEITRDTLLNGERILELCITPQRHVDRLEVFTNDIAIEKASVNGLSLPENFLKNRRNGKLVTHFISNGQYTEIQLGIPPNEPLELTFYEASNNLLYHPDFSIPPRPANNIPMPFVLNDAVMTVKTVSF